MLQGGARCCREVQRGAISCGESSGCGARNGVQPKVRLSCAGQLCWSHLCAHLCPCLPWQRERGVHRVDHLHTRDVEHRFPLRRQKIHKLVGHSTARRCALLQTWRADSPLHPVYNPSPLAGRPALRLRHRRRRLLAEPPRDVTGKVRGVDGSQAAAGGRPAAPFLELWNCFADRGTEGTTASRKVMG